MKAKRRHELKSNELVEWLRHLPEFWRRNFRTMIYIAVVLVITGVVAYFKWYQKRARTRQQRITASQFISELGQSKYRAASSASRGEDASARLLEVASLLEGVAGQSEDDGLTALALIKRGEALRSELHYRAFSLEEEAAKGQIRQARRCYRRALDKAGSDANLAATAKFGLGLCAEELGDFERAEGFYREVAEYEGTAAAVQARHRLETMAEYKEEIFFPEIVEPPEEPEEVSVEVEPAVVEELATEGVSESGAGAGVDEPNDG